MDIIDRIRAFNRFYTAWLGVLDRNFLQSGLGLTEARVLYELGRPEPPAARAMAAGLGLDEGYLSRILKRFAAAGWLDRRPDPEDARRARLGLTAAGTAALADLRARSRAAIGSQIAGLSAGDAGRLTGAMAEMRALLGDTALPPVTLRDLGPGDAGWVIERHGALYAENDGFDATFEALVGEIMVAVLRDRDPACERGWIATRGGRRVGCIFCMRDDAETARLRLFLVLPEARGTGLGTRLLDECLDFARGCDYRRLVLWTHESHRAACALYRKRGFRLTDQHDVRSFGQDLVAQNWEIDL